MVCAVLRDLDVDAPFARRRVALRMRAVRVRDRLPVTAGSHCYEGSRRSLLLLPYTRFTLCIVKPATARTRTVAYLRVSTDKQADHGVSLDVQRGKVAAYAQLFDLDLVAIEVDAGVSAKSLERPALQRALAMLKSGKADALLVVKLDRLTRSVRDLCDLVDRYFRDGKLALMSVGEQVDTRTAMGRGMLNIIAVLGQMEREQIGERTSAALQYKRSKHEYTGGKNVPYGFALADDGESLEPIQAEQYVIAAARELRTAGMPLRSIAATLDEHGHRSRRGRRFAAQQIARMLETA
jgi:site-specific DNA recombinase